MLHAMYRTRNPVSELFLALHLLDGRAHAGNHSSLLVRKNFLPEIHIEHWHTDRVPRVPTGETWKYTLTHECAYQLQAAGFVELEPHSHEKRYRLRRCGRAQYDLLCEAIHDIHQRAVAAVLYLPPDSLTWLKNEWNVFPDECYVRYQFRNIFRTPSGAHLAASGNRTYVC